MGGWTAATEVQQEIFLHLALMSVELANSFWPRKLSAAPIRVFNYEGSSKRLKNISFLGFR